MYSRRLSDLSTSETASYSSRLWRRPSRAFNRYGWAKTRFLFLFINKMRHVSHIATVLLVCKASFVFDNWLSSLNCFSPNEASSEMLLHSHILMSVQPASTSFASRTAEVESWKTARSKSALLTFAVERWEKRLFNYAFGFAWVFCSPQASNAKNKLAFHNST